MRKVLLILFLGFASQLSLAQVRVGSEVGVGVGTMNYTGDMVRLYSFKNSRLGVQMIYRNAINDVVSLKSSLTYGKVGAEEKPIDALAVNRKASFNISLVEAALGFEFHFLNWRENIRINRFTPYAHMGIALFGISGHKVSTKEHSKVQISIPLGVGLKYTLTPRYYIALEFGIRKTFYDHLDNISDGDTRYKNYQYGNPHDYDNYYYSGISISYTFYEIPCPSSPHKGKLINNR